MPRRPWRRRASRADAADGRAGAHVYKEILIYALVAASSLFLMTFVAHMLVGGLVSPQTEQIVTIALCGTVACVIGVMAWDVVRRRRGRRLPPPQAGD